MHECMCGGQTYRRTLNRLSQAAMQSGSSTARPCTSMELAYTSMGKTASRLCRSYTLSRWIEVFPTSSATSAVVVEELRTIFANFEIPETTIMADNGTCFLVLNLELSCRVTVFAILHLHTALNGMAECVVLIVKKGLKKTSNGDWPRPYGISSHPTYDHWDFTRAALRPRCLDLLKPHTANCVEKQQEKQKEFMMPELEVGNSMLERVFVCNYHQGDRWLGGGVVQKQTGPVSFVSYRISSRVEESADAIKIRLDYVLRMWRLKSSLTQ